MPVTEYLKPEGFHRPRGYVHVTVSEGSAIHVGGQVADDVDGNLQHPGDYEAQAEAAARNFFLAVQGAGAEVGDIARIGVYVVGLNAETNDLVFSGFGKAAQAFGVRIPAVVGLGIAAIAVEGALVEVDGVAYR